MPRRLLAPLALSFVLAAASAAQQPATPPPGSTAAAPAAQEPVTVTWRVDPPVVAPGGWVDVVAAYDVAPGWYFASPSSPKGPRATLGIEGPKDWRRNTSLWTHPGRMLDDPTHGAINAFGGRGGMRWRYHVPAALTDGRYEFKGQLTLVLSDGKAAREPQTFEGAVSVAVDSSGSRGPQLRNLDIQTPLSPEEQALLSKNGFVVRSRAEFGVARSKDVAVVTLDILLEPGAREEALNIFCEPQERRFIPLPGWRAFHAEVGMPDGKQTRSMREVLPLEFWDDGLSGDLRIPIEVTLTTVRGQDKASRMATQSIAIAMRYER